MVDITNGVLQAEVQSPTMFTQIIADLEESLEAKVIISASMNYLIKILILAHADDLCILLVQAVSKR